METSSSKGQLADLLSRAVHHPFYEQRTSHAPPPAGLQEWPVTTRTQLAEAVQARLQSSPIEEWNGVSWSASAASGGHGPLFCPVDLRALREQHRLLARDVGSSAGGGMFRNTDCVANLVWSSSVYQVFWTVTELCFLAGATDLPIAGACPSPDALAVCKTFRPNVFVGDSLRLVEHALWAQEHEPELKAQRIVSTGTPMTKARRKVLEEALGAESFTSLFGTAETGTCAYQPEGLPSGHYLLCEDVAHAEIQDPDDSGLGRILMTHLLRKRFPIIRYDIGDYGRLHEKTFQGRKRKVLEVSRQTDHMCTVGSKEIPLTALEQILEAHPGLQTLGFQVVAKPGGGDGLTLRLAAACDKASAQNLVADVARAINARLHIPAEVLLVEPSELTRAPRGNRVLPITEG